MQLILPQVKKEWLSQRWALLVWYGLLGVEVVRVGTGFWGNFQSPSSSGFGDGLSEIIKLFVAIGVVMIPASLALNDPPTQETAHWQVLPVRPWILLIAKLWVILVFMLVPLCMTHIAAIWLSEASMWIGTVMLDLLSSYPSWMLLGFAFGAATGDWRRFSILLTLFWSGVMLAIFLAESLQSMNSRLGYWLDSKGLNSAIQNCFYNSLFLLGSVAVILLRYFTHFSGRMLTFLFLLCLPLTVNVLPLFIRGFVSHYQTEAMVQDRRITIKFAQPTSLLSYTNQTNLRVTGPSLYSKLTMEGLDENYFLMPAWLNAALQVYEETDPTVRKTFGSRTSMVPSYFEHMPFENHLLENMFALPKLQPSMDVINQINSNEMQFDLFDLDATVLKFIGKSLVDLDIDWWVKPYRFELMGDLTLEKGSEFSNNGTTVRLVAWLPDGEDRTQIKLHVRTVALQKRVRETDPRWDVSSMRFLLINEQANEVCFSNSSSSSSLSDFCHVGFHSIIREFSVTDDSNNRKPIPADWLKNAKLRVFRIFPGAQTKVDQLVEKVNIVDLPIFPRADPESEVVF